MIKEILPIFLLVFLLNHANAQQKRITIVEGHLENATNVVYLSKVDYTDTKKLELLIDSVDNDHFRFELEITEPQLFRVFTDNDTLPLFTTKMLPRLLDWHVYYMFNCLGYYQQIAEVFIQPGDSLHIKLHFNKRGINTSEYSGDRSLENTYLAKYRPESDRRSNWAYTYLGTGSTYRNLSPDKVIKKSNNQTERIQKKQNRYKDVMSEAFIDFISNHNKASGFQIASNILNYIDSTDVRLFFEMNQDFKQYETLYELEPHFDKTNVFEYAQFVFIELLVTYQLNTENNQSKRHYPASEEKFLAAMRVLNDTQAKVYGAKIINELSRNEGNSESLQKLSEAYLSRFDDPKYLNL